MGEDMWLWTVISILLAVFLVVATHKLFKK